MKVYICCSERLYQTGNRGLLEEIIRETIKVIKMLCVKYASVSDIAKGNLMASNNRCFLIRHQYHHCSRWSVDPQYF